MARMMKLPNPSNAAPHTSRWLMELTASEVSDIASGGAATLTVTLPISDPEATITIRRAGAGALAPVRP